MQKVVVQIVIFVGLFFMTWFSFRQVDWMKAFNVSQKTKSTEEKLGDFIWEALVRTEDEIKDRKIITPVDSLLTRICISNKIDRKKIKLHILNSSEVNAFALPNHHLVVFSGLINESINENELSGVISHELAHIELNHVMKKLVKEVGLSVLLSMTTGSGGEVVKEIVRLISSSAYDRSLETEADLQAVEYMLKSHLNPEALANFLYRLSNNKDDLSKHLDWVSTHPNPEERAETIIDNSHDRKVTFKPVLTKREWEALQKRIEKDN